MRTRGALVDAAYQLLQAGGYEGLTVDAVAERAGVSRRTFFNYFASLPDALTSHVQDMLAQAVEVFHRAPQGEDFAEVARLALAPITAEGTLARAAYLHYCAERSPQLMATSLLVWEQARREVAELFSRRYPNADALLIAVAVEVILGALYAAFHVWGANLHSAPNSSDVRRLVPLLHEALDLACEPEGVVAALARRSASSSEALKG